MVLDAAIRDLGLEFFESYSRVLDTSRGIEWATWFGGGTVNLAHNCVDRWAERTLDAAAIVWEGEEGATTWVSYRELRERSDRLANDFASLGVSALDAVGIFPATHAGGRRGRDGMFEARRGVAAAVLRVRRRRGREALQDAQAKVLITADGQRRGKVVPMKETADEAVASARSVRHVVVVDRFGRRDTPWDSSATCAGTTCSRRTRTGSRPRVWIPEDPLFIAWPSGTTADPRARVHVHGGFVKIAEEVAYQTDVQPGDLLFWFADLGWIMGPWEIVWTARSARRCSCSTARRTIPARTGSGRWRTARDHASGGLADSRTRVDPLGRRACAGRLSPILASTGEPWNPDPTGGSSRRSVRAELPIINLSGGTEVGACFLSPHPISPLEPCTLRGPASGWTSRCSSRHREAGPGEVGGSPAAGRGRA